MIITETPVLIAACGNAIAGDESFGSLVAQRLRNNPPPGVEIVDLDLSSTKLLNHLPGREVLVIVDAAVAMDRPAGELVVCDWNCPTRPRVTSEKHPSPYAMSLSMQLELARRLGVLPPVVRLVAVTIASAEIGTDASDAIATQVATADLAVRRIVRSLI